MRGEKTRDETRQDEPGLDDWRLDKKRRAVVYDRRHDETRRKVNKRDETRGFETFQEAKML